MSTLSKKEKREHQNNWCAGWQKLAGLYSAFMSELAFINRPPEQKEQIRLGWLCQLCRNEAGTIALMGEAYRALNLKEFYED